jgi:hypothetical protein
VLVYSVESVEVVCGEVADRASDVTRDVPCTQLIGVDRSRKATTIGQGIETGGLRSQTEGL